MKQINSLKELNDERQRITGRIRDLEIQIEMDAEIIKSDLNVWRTAGEKVKDFLITEENGIMGESIGIAVDTFVKKLLFKKSNWVFKFVLSFVLKNFTKNYFAKNAENIFEKIKNRMSNHHRETATVD